MSLFLRSETGSVRKDKRIIADQLVAPSGIWTSSPTSWLHHLALRLHRRPVRCTIWHSDFVADQLVGLLGARFISQPTGQTVRRLGFIGSYAGGLPTMMGTPRYSDSSCKNSQLSWGLPWWSNFATTSWLVQICWPSSEPCCCDLGVPRWG